MHQGMNAGFAERVAAGKEVQFHHEGATGDASTGTARKFKASGGRAAGRDQIINQQHRIVWTDGINMHVQFGTAVFEVVAHGIRRGRQLAGLAQRYEADFQFMSGQRAKHETACFHTEYCGNARITEWSDEFAAGER